MAAPSPATPPLPAIILLAAGESSRMGQPKQLLPWRGLPLLAYQMRQAQATTAGEIIVVLGSNAAALRSIANAHAGPARTRIVVNRRWRQGKTASIKAGLRALSRKPSAVMLLSVDQPRPRAILQRLLDAHAAAAAPRITVPAHRGAHGHPPVFTGSLLPDLLAVSEATLGLRAVLHRHRDALQAVPFRTALVVTNLNRAADYAAAFAAYGRSLRD